MLVRRSLRCLVVGVLAALTPVMLAGSVGSSTAWASASSSSPCTVTGPSVPTCGRWWGAALDPVNGSLTAAVAANQASTGRRLDIVHTYHRWDDAFPTVAEAGVALSGHLLLVGWKPLTLAGAVVSWSSIADGSQDAIIEAEATRLKALDLPVLLSFSYEPEKLVGVAGTPAQFAAAFRHVHDVMVRSGARQVRFVWTVMGLDSTHWHTLYHQLWPGNRYVDWIAWDPYNWASCRNTESITFAQMVRPFYRWVTTQHFGNQPVMLAEYGTTQTTGAPDANAAWYAGESRSLAAFPRLRALVYFDLPAPPASCDWLTTASPSSESGFASLADGASFRETALLRPTAFTRG
jgi:hypothetical protein